jgi:pimeloyl-ACP methyl ester carboxylesterase
MAQTEHQPSRRAPRRWTIGRIIRWAIIVLVVLLLATFLLLPIGFAIYATRDAHEAAGAPPAGFTAVRPTTADGTTLAAWYAPPRNGAAILLLHGAGDARAATRSYAEMLVKHGFGVLALDLRGHGESEGRTNRFGWRGTEDVRAALAFLREQDGVRATGGLGLSLGGEVLLGAAADNPALAAIVAEGATARTLAEFQAVPSHRNPISSLQPWVLYTTVALLTGDGAPPPLLDSIRATAQTRFLLVAAGQARDEAEFNRLFAAAAPGRAELWVAPDVGHTGAFAAYPDEYEQRVVDFFTATLLD